MADEAPSDNEDIYATTPGGVKKSRSFVDKRTGIVVKISTKAPVIPLYAKIKTITMKGLMTVTFSDEMLIPANYSRFNE